MNRIQFVPVILLPYFDHTIFYFASWQLEVLDSTNTTNVLYIDNKLVLLRYGDSAHKIEINRKEYIIPIRSYSNGFIS